MDIRRKTIFSGYFGSGKSEIAINYALMLKQKGYKTCIVDMDIVNPYFRTVDAKKQLEDKGIKVIASMFANSNIDIPALNPETNRTFEDDELYSVFDIGGDDLGAKAISRFSKEFLKDEYNHFFVVNINRPMTDTAEAIIKVAKEIETAARVPFTGIVNNSNLLKATTVDHIEAGREMIFDVAGKLKLPIAFECIMKDLCYNDYKNDNEVLVLEKMLKLPWE